MTGLEPKLFVFLLSTFLGLEVIRRVSPLLHTPLMSLTNAIASISVVGAILISGEKDASMLSRVLGFVAVVSATTNLVSGYLITDDRMMTSIPGLFAAGDVRSQLTRQITTAVGDATTAAVAVEKYLTDRKSRSESKAQVSV